MRRTFAISRITGSRYKGPNTVVSLLRSIMRWERKIEVHVIGIRRDGAVSVKLQHCYRVRVFTSRNENVSSRSGRLCAHRIRDPVVCSRPPCCTAKVWFLCYRLPFLFWNKLDVGHFTRRFHYAWLLDPLTRRYRKQWVQF